MTQSVQHAYFIRIFLGLGLTILTFSAGFLGSYIFFPDAFPTQIFNKNDNQQLDPSFLMEFDYHNFTTNNTDIYSLMIAYRQYQSPLLNHSVPNLMGITATHLSAMKHDWRGPTLNNYSAILDDNYWWVGPHISYEFNQYNISMDMGGILPINGTPRYENFYIESQYIAYEIDHFSTSILQAVNHCTVLTPENPSYPTLDHISEQFILNIEILFTNFTQVNLRLHADGWGEMIIWKCEYFSYEECDACETGLKYCGKMVRAQPDQYFLYSDHFDNFHTQFAQYLRTHVYLDPTSN